MRFPAKITSSCIWVAILVDRVILHWYACGVAGRCTVTCLPNFLGWVDNFIFLPMVLRSRTSRARAPLFKENLKVSPVLIFQWLLLIKQPKLTRVWVAPVWSSFDALVAGLSLYNSCLVSACCHGQEQWMVICPKGYWVRNKERDKRLWRWIKYEIKNFKCLQQHLK